MPSSSKCDKCHTGGIITLQSKMLGLVLAVGLTCQLLLPAVNAQSDYIITDLGSLGTLPGHTNSAAQAVNVQDQVVGYSALFFTGPYPFLWTKATGMLNLNILIDSSSGWQLIDATGINANGQITGWGIFKGENHGFVLTPKDTF